jgi:RHS repeat-associated protein
MTTHTAHASLRVVLLSAGIALFSACPATAQSEVEYYAADAVGSIRVVFDGNGTAVARSDYLPFGEAYAMSGAMPFSRYTGQQRDPEAGLDNFNARSFDPAAGRFTRLDPAGGDPKLPQTWNRYAYGRNDPLGFNDPSGMVERSVVRNGPLPDWLTSQHVIGGGAYSQSQYATHSPGAPGTPGALERQLSGQGYYSGGEIDAAMAAYGAAVDSAFDLNWAENYAASHPAKPGAGRINNQTGDHIWSKPEDCPPGSCLERVSNNSTTTGDGFTIENRGEIYKVPDFVEVVVLPGGGAIIGTYGVGIRFDMMQQFPHRDVGPGAQDLVGMGIHAASAEVGTRHRNG